MSASLDRARRADKAIREAIAPFDKLRLAIDAVYEATGRPPGQFVVMPDGDVMPYRGAVGDVLVTEKVWREAVRTFLRDYERRKPRKREVELRMRGGAQFMGVPVNSSRLPPLDG